MSAAASFSSQTAPSQNTSKFYMYDYEAEHIWKNNSTATTVMEFYILHPRRDIPVGFITPDGKTADTSNTISPPNTDTYTDCANIAPYMYIQGFLDPGLGDGGSAKVGSADIEATPYMAGPLTSIFKIKRLRVKGPGGLASTQSLPPGSSCTYHHYKMKPILVNFNKFGLSGKSAASISSTYEVLRGCPLIFAYIRGGVGHDNADKTIVDTTSAYCDYVRKSRWKKLITVYGNNSTITLTAHPTITTSREVEQYGGGAAVTDADA